MTMVIGAPDVAAPAVPPARLVTPAAAVIASAASPNRHQMPCSMRLSMCCSPPPKVPPDCPVERP